LKTFYSVLKRTQLFETFITKRARQFVISILKRTQLV
jgi:hypothetical protein